MQQLTHFKHTIYSKVPPSTEASFVLQRTDEVNTLLRMLNEPQTHAVILTGDPGAGKSTLAALLYRRLQLTAQSGSLGIKHFIWLSLGPDATLPDVIAAIFSSLGIGNAHFFLFKPEQQISLLLQALRRPQQSAFVVLDQFEELLTSETAKGLVGRGAIPAFFGMLQQDLRASRLLLTSHRSPDGFQNDIDTSIRSYLVSHVSLPEGVALLQQRGVRGSREELSLVWQRCAGQVFALVLFSTLVALSGFSLSYLLNIPDYQVLWNGEVTLNLAGLVFYSLNALQRTLMRTLCLFREPAVLPGILMAIEGEDTPKDKQNGNAELAFRDELQVLVRLSLVQTLNRDGQQAYLLHPLLRQYTLEHYMDRSNLHPSGELTIALNKAVKHKRERGQQRGARQASPPLREVGAFPVTISGHDLGETDQPEAIAEDLEKREIALGAGHMRVAGYYLGQARQNCPPREKWEGPRDIEPFLVAARHLCLGRHWQDAYNLLFTEGLHESMMQWGVWNTLIGLYTSMLPPRGMLRRWDEGQAASNLGLLYDRLGNTRQSRAYYEHALTVQREVGDQHGEAITLTNLGELFRSQGVLQQARANFEQAVILNRQLHDQHLECVLLHNMGLLSQREKDYMQALSYYQKALKLAHSLKEASQEGMILTNIGMLLYEQGSVAEALALLFSALHIRRSLQDPTLDSLVFFLYALEQKMGSEAFACLRQSIQGIQEQILSRLASSNVRQ